MSTKYQHTPFKGTPTEPLTPGSDEWARTVSASKVPGILGISPYDSAYSLWARATGRLENIDPAPEVVALGNMMEPHLLEWLETQVPGIRVKPSGAYVHPDNPSWTVAPDGLVYEGRRRTPYALVEAKTARRSDEWGTPGTAEIPPNYLAQCAWQMWVTGARTVFVPALVAMELVLYVVRWDDVADDMPAIVDAVREWEACVLRDAAPDWDGSTATYEAVRRLHPDIDPEGVAEIPAWWAIELWDAIDAEKSATAEAKRCKSRILDAAGSAKTILTDDGRRLGTRTSRNGGTPYLNVSKPQPVTIAA